MRLRLVSDAASEPVTTAELMDFARIDVDPGGTLLASLIKAARRRVERDTGLALLTQTWVGVMDRWPNMPAPDYKAPLTDPWTQGITSAGLWWDGVRNGPIALFSGVGVFSIPKRPFQSLTKISVRQMDATFIDLDSSTYYVEVSDWMAHVCRMPNTSWLTPRAPMGGIEVTFKAGFGDTAASVPDDLLMAVKMLAAYWHEQREPVIDGRFGPAPNHYDALIGVWRGMRVA